MVYSHYEDNYKEDNFGYRRLFEYQAVFISNNIYKPIMNGGKTMNNEKMRVLDLLEAGKITAEDAAMLLDSLGKGPGFMSKETRDNVEDKLQRFAQECGKLAKEVGEKVHVFYKDVEPKIKKASQTALEKAACALENLACTISESLEKVECCCDDENCCCNTNTECCTDDGPQPN